jgi:hypothetical protein
MRTGLSSAQLTGRPTPVRRPDPRSAQALLDQKQLPVGYPRHTASAATPTASWSGWPSRRHGARHHRPGEQSWPTSSHHRREQIRLRVTDRAGLQPEPVTAHFGHTQQPVGGQDVAPTPGWFRGCVGRARYRALAIADGKTSASAPCAARYEITPPHKVRAPPRAVRRGGPSGSEARAHDVRGGASADHGRDVSRAVMRPAA